MQGNKVGEIHFKGAGQWTKMLAVSIGLLGLIACGGSRPDTPDPELGSLSGKLALLGTPGKGIDSAQMLVRGDSGTNTQSFRITLSEPTVVRYCVDDADPNVLRVAVRDSGDQLVWEHQRSTLDGRPDCTQARGASLQAGEYKVTVEGRKVPGPDNPVFVYSPADADRAMVRAPLAPENERWPIRFATGQVLQMARAGASGAELTLVEKQALESLDERHFFSVSRKQIGGYEQVRMYSHNKDQKPTAMLNWQSADLLLRMTSAFDETTLPLAPVSASGTKAVDAYLRPLGGARYAYCFLVNAFTEHRCLGARKDGMAGVYRTDDGMFAVGSRLASADPDYLDGSGELIANPRYIVNTNHHGGLLSGEVLLSFALPSTASSGIPSGLLYGQHSSFVPQNWRPAWADLGPDTELSVDGGQSWIGASGALPLKDGETVKEIKIRRTRWDLLVTTRSCRGCDLRAFVGTSGPLNLKDTDLRGSYLTNPKDSTTVRGADFSGANLANADLTGALLWVGQFANTDLTGTNLRSVMLLNVNFTGAQMRGTDLTAAKFNKVSLDQRKSVGERTVLVGARFDGAVFEQATEFGSAAIGCTRMRWITGVAGLDGARMQCVDMSDSDLRKFRFGRASNFLGADALSFPRDAGEQCPAAILNAQPQTDGSFAAISCRGASMRGSKLTIQSLPLDAWRKVDLSNVQVERNSDGSWPVSFAGQDFSKGRFDGFDWSGTDLSEVNFSAASLRGVNLAQTILHGAQFFKADLSTLGNSAVATQRTSFKGASLRGANLAYANATGADFSQSVMNADPKASPSARESLPANLSYLYAPGSLFEEADMAGVNLSNAHIYGNSLLSFRKANLSQTNLSNGVFSGVNFAESILQGTQFTNANLVNATFTGATLSSLGGQVTSFSGAFLQGADFSKVNALGVNFSGANISFSRGSLSIRRLKGPGQLEDVFISIEATQLPAVTDQKTICPNGASGPCSVNPLANWTALEYKLPTCVPDPTGESWCPSD
jgi:uncharacterized protein YjbI with pentapeptide repeats